ncbi:MAG: type II toxin-antitoxin system RelE/ParE family toxin [Cytophagales bacterium]
MIKTFGNKDSELLWNGVQTLKYPLSIQNVARRKLRMINSSENLNDLRVPPSNRLEKLSGNLKDYFSIRINRQWRIIFKWKDQNAYGVIIIDYH